MNMWLMIAIAVAGVYHFRRTMNMRYIGLQGKIED